jgi:hypothetical protein
MNKKIHIHLFLILAAVLSGCSFVRGSGVVVTETREVSNFDRVELKSIGELVITQGESESLTVEAESNIARRVNTDVWGGTLTIEFTSGILGDVIPSEPIRYDLTVKDLSGIKLSGAGRIYSANITTSNIDLDVSGVGDVIIDNLEAEDLEASLTGAGTIDLAGKVDDQGVRLSSVGNYSAGGLETTHTRIDLTGAGTATLWVTEALDVKISGVGSVDYYGNPVVTQDISGLGRLNQLGNP